jgi:RNA polymerase subunit RPABC4/transcription elongation factor Spt4
MSFNLFGGETINCRSCGKTVSTDAEVCPHCGEHLSESKPFGADTIACRTCGNTISSDATVCPKCGAAVKEFKLFETELTECPACGKQVSADAEICPHCNAVLSGNKLFYDVKECRTCGAKVSTDAEVCPNCGDTFEGFKFFGGSVMECHTCHRKISTEAVACPYCGAIYKDEVYPKQVSSRLTNSKKTKREEDEEESGGDLMGKLIGYLVVIGLVIWGVIWLMKNIVGPLMIINISFILFIIGFTKRVVREVMLVLAFLAAILIVADYKSWIATGWVVKDGVTSGIIPFCFYLNLLAGLVAAYLFVCDLLKKNAPATVNEFSKQNIITMSSLFAVGLTLVLVPASDARHAGTPYLVNSSSQVNYQAPATTNVDAAYSIPPATVTDSVVVDTTVKIAPVEFTGRVGMLDANFILWWYPDSSIEGSYTYPSRDNSSYTLKGKELETGSILLTEYTNGVETAKCELKFQNGCYVGKMKNADGRTLNMFFCGLNDSRIQGVADSIALLDAAKEVQPDINDIRSEFQRINAVALQKVQLNNLTYYMENNQIVKIVANCNSGNQQTHIEYYYKGERLFFTYKIYKDLSLNEKDPAYKTEYRTYVKDDKAIKLLVNKDLKQWNQIQFDYSSIEYRALEACKQNRPVDVCE